MVALPRRGSVPWTHRWWGYALALALGLACLAVAGCSSDDASSSVVVYSSSGSTHGLSDPTWYVAPSLEEQIYSSTVIVRATLQSASGATTTATGGHQAVQELRFTVHEYLKGSGPSTLVVAVRDDYVYAGESTARAVATAAVARRTTAWDDREGVLFLSALDQAYTPTGGAAAGSALGFTRSNPNQSPWAYSVDRLSRAWLPAQQAGGSASAAGTQTYITDGARTPTPTITLAALRAQIATLTAELQANAGVAGYERCVRGRIRRERYYRGDEARSGEAWKPSRREERLASGAAVGTVVYRRQHPEAEPQYNRYWLSGPDAARFQTATVDADNQPSTGYEHRLATARPLPAGVYRVFYNSQHYTRIPCNFKPDDAYTDVTVTVTAPIGTLHEAFFDPVTIGAGVGAGGGQGTLTSTTFSVGTTSTTMQRLVWDAKQIQLDLSAPVTLSSHALEVIGSNGKAALQLNFKQATSAPLPGGGQAWRWRVCTTTAPWKTGDQLMLRLHPVASIAAEASGALGCGPAPTFGATSYAFTTAENTAVGTTVGAVKATGQGKDAVTYALTAGNTGGAFAVNASTGAITVAKALDYETTASYTLTVQAEQPTSAVAAVSVTITVTDVAETPRRRR